ncbi:MAG: MIP/aquaporin family protein [Bacillota bacterium]
MELYIAEFFGTMLLALFGVGVVAGVVLKGTKSNGSGWIVITFGWGLGVAMAVYATGWISGAHINPAVTIAEWSLGNLTFGEMIGYMVSQVLGAFTGAAIILGMYYPHYKVEQSKEGKLATFSTAPEIRHTPANFFSEVVGTFALVFGIQGIFATFDMTDNAGLAGAFAPLLVGLLVAVIGLSLGGTTGYAINPARDLGPRLTHFLLPVPDKGDSDWRYSWVPIVGPLIGGALGGLSYHIILGESSFADLSGMFIGFIVAYVLVQIFTFFISVEKKA